MTITLCLSYVWIWYIMYINFPNILYILFIVIAKYKYLLKGCGSWTLITGFTKWPLRFAIICKSVPVEKVSELIFSLRRAARLNWRRLNHYEYRHEQRLVIKYHFKPPPHRFKHQRTRFNSVLWHRNIYR